MRGRESRRVARECRTRRARLARYQLRGDHRAGRAGQDAQAARSAPTSSWRDPGGRFAGFEDQVRPARSDPDGAGRGTGRSARAPRADDPADVVGAPEPVPLVRRRSAAGSAGARSPAAVTRSSSWTSLAACQKSSPPAGVGVHAEQHGLAVPSRSDSVRKAQCSGDDSQGRSGPGGGPGQGPSRMIDRSETSVQCRARGRPRSVAARHCPGSSSSARLSAATAHCVIATIPRPSSARTAVPFAIRIESTRRQTGRSTGILKTGWRVVDRLWVRWSSRGTR